MNVSCMQTELRSALATVSRAVATRSPLPITNNVLIVAGEGRLTLSATNLELGIVQRMSAKVESEGSITVPAKLFVDTVSTFPNELVFMESSQTNVLTVKCGKFRARINGLGADDFPPIPTASEGAVITVEPIHLREAIPQAIVAASEDDTRPTLCGVYAKFGQECTLAATDGFRLAVRTLPLISPVDEVEVIIPTVALSELSRNLARETEPVSIVVTPNRNQIVFHLSNVDIVSQLVQGQFANYPQLIPASFETKINLNTEEFSQGVRASAIFAKDNAIIRLQAEVDDEGIAKMIVSARGDKTGDNVSEVSATLTGEPKRIAFNVDYLRDGLAVMKSGQIAMGVNSAQTPASIVQVGDSQYLYLLIPMFVQWEE